jgi:hypothetical protein
MGGAPPAIAVNKQTDWRCGHGIVDGLRVCLNIESRRSSFMALHPSNGDGGPGEGDCLWKQ